MSNYFQGASLFTGEEISIAISNFKVQQTKWGAFLLNKIEVAESEYKPSWLRKRISGDTLYSRWGKLRTSTKWWYPYSRWMVMEGYVILTEEEKEKLLDLNILFNPWSNRDEGTYEQLVKLGDGDRGCYLNPEQSSFITKYTKE